MLRWCWQDKKYLFYLCTTNFRVCGVEIFFWWYWTKISSCQMEDRNKLWITELSCSLNKWLEQDQTHNSELSGQLCCHFKHKYTKNRLVVKYCRQISKSINKREREMCVWRDRLRKVKHFIWQPHFSELQTT